MENRLFTDLLCALLALLLLWAAVGDVRRRTISNPLNLAIALLAPLYWYGMAVGLWPDAAIRIGIAAAIFLLLALAFQLGAMGGGDVKLAAALVLWFPPAATLAFIVLMSIAAVNSRYDLLWSAVVVITAIAAVAYGAVATVERVVLSRVAPEQLSW